MITTCRTRGTLQDDNMSNRFLPSVLKFCNVARVCAYLVSECSSFVSSRYALRRGLDYRFMRRGPC